ncbi:MAG: DNA repair protein RecN [Candidatus Zixiibacteriota bacterium]
MLYTLRIKNFAIVESLEIPFEGGLSVFTGETGAGKTILVEAIRFLLGGRTGVEMVRTGADGAVVEAQFDAVKNAPVAGIDADAIAVPFWLRRELSPTGTARAFLNNRQITRTALQALGEHLADLCGQHQHQVLLDPERHVEWLDRYAGNGDWLAELATEWTALAEARRRQIALAVTLTERRRQEELRRFQLTELRAANVQPDEDERLRTEATVLKNARRLAEAAESALTALTEDEQATETVLGRLRREAENCRSLDPRWEMILEPLTAALDATTETIRALAAYREQLTFDPTRLDQIESRLAELHRLKSKYGGSCASVGEALLRLEGEEHDNDSLERQIAQSRESVLAGEREVLRLATELTAGRRDAALALGKTVTAAIARLGMAGARIDVELTPHTDGELAITTGQGTVHIHADGAERARFLFEANPREGFKPLDKIASGGELSRLLLAFKSITAAPGDATLSIFDEIDAGLGGQTAHMVAEQIHTLARTSQVFLISHLQQLAAVADQHYRITKKTIGGRARVSITRLDEEERVRELARMVAGDAVTERTLQFASELTQPRPSPRKRR